MDVHFVGTAWRDREELFELRRALYGGDARAREAAVSKVYAWKVRKLEIPLLLESTADLVDAVVQDERGTVPHNALRMVYATAVSRFITGLADTQTDLSRLRPSWFPPTTTLHFPTALRETRHCIVHRHLPSLCSLKAAASESLAWLWEWYWSHLDAAFHSAASPAPTLSAREAKERLQALLKSYVKERKGEITRRAKTPTAAAAAASSFLFLDAALPTKQPLLSALLVAEKAILPSDKKFGTSMSGAFLVWTPFLQALCRTTPSFLRHLLDELVAALAASSQGFVDAEADPGKEGVYAWVVHILSSSEWRDARCSRLDSARGVDQAEVRLRDHVLSECFMAPSYWSLKVVETLLGDDHFAAGRESWAGLLKAARSEDEVGDEEDAAGGDVMAMAEDVDVEAHERVLSSSKKRKGATTMIRGPQKKVGLWRPQPIGTIPKGWEVDE